MAISLSTLGASSKWVEAVASLNELTQTKRLKWEVDPTTPLGSPSPKIYRAKYMDRWIRLTAMAEQFAALGGFLGTIPSQQYILEITDDVGTSLFRVPESTGLKDLYQSVLSQLSGVDEILNSLIRERSGRI